MPCLACNQRSPLPPPPTATPRPRSRTAPGYTTSCPRCVISHLSSFTSASHFTWPPLALLNSCRAVHVLITTTLKFHLTSKLSRPTAHPQFSASTLKTPVVPVANCPRFTCAGLEMVSEQDGPSNRGLISLTACLALLQNVCVSNLSSLYSWSRHVLVPKRIGTKAVCGMFFCIYRAHLRHSFPPP